MTLEKNSLPSYYWRILNARAKLGYDYANGEKKDYLLHIERSLNDTINRREKTGCVFYLNLASLPGGLGTLNICRHLQKTHCLVFPYLFMYLLDRKKEIGVYSKQLLFTSSPHLSLLSYVPIFNFGFRRIKQEHSEEKEKKKITMLISNRNSTFLRVHQY